MVYRLVRFNLGSGRLDAAKKIFTDLVPKISAQPRHLALRLLRSIHVESKAFGSLLATRGKEE